jgi:hypothetical protein
VNAAPHGLVDVVREFLTAHRELGRLFALDREGRLRFEDLDRVFVDDERSALFRLKERCHALFRARPGHAREPSHREVLFDLAVGSLFHEAMKLRESLYQREVYGPRVRALRAAAGDGADALFDEFERILSRVSVRLREGVEETESLLAQMRSQLVLLLAEHADDGLVMRCLLERDALVGEVFGEGVDALFARLQRGDAARGFALAGDSYLESGHYEEAERAYAAAGARGGEPTALARGCAYARGMRAYLAGDYRASVDQLASWTRGAGEGDDRLAAVAHTALSKLDRLVQGPERGPVLANASALAERLAALRAPRAAPGAAPR